VERHAASGVEPSSLHIEDLYLAYACTQGNEAALRAFERRYLSQIDHFLPPRDRDPTFVDELRQALREKFFVTRNTESSKIADYSGRGTLHSWVRTATVHTARNMNRARRSDPLRDSDEDAVLALASGQDPELSHLKVKYQPVFKEAIQAAIASLSFEQREVMRLHYLDGLNIDRIGERLGVNRATVARWRTAAKQAIFEEIQRQLRKRLGLSDSEFGSLVQLLRSQIEISLVRLFRP
jgi:RNA polymerase sigma-70 factor (ECF subfamily)